MNRALGKVGVWHFVWIAIVLSELLTSLVSLILKGRIEKEFLITGGIVSVIAATAIMISMRKMIRLSFLKRGYKLFGIGTPTNYRAPFNITDYVNTLPALNGLYSFVMAASGLPNRYKLSPIF